jgi:diaminohydroxyphosphoribosylaminopyrimidine deaminase/5-amino-6-(5-phosphoribosylamino)uracil reductase
VPEPTAPPLDGTPVRRATPAAVAPSRRVDVGFLARAVAVAHRAGQRAHPNPTVGCVLVRDGDIVGEGVTAPVGGPHAEVRALGAAGAAARDATAYVTLEPCSHHGRTPPCTDALLDAGIGRVVVAHPDPDPLARGGAEVLREAGVEVVFPSPTSTAVVAGQLEGFLTELRHGRPHVTLKLAQTVDGQLLAPDGERWLTGPRARAAVHRWRAAADAVLVGIGTVLADDPSLDVRHVPTDRQPRAVVVDTDARTPPSAAVARPGTIVLRGAAGAGGADADALAAALAARGVEVRPVATGSDGHLDVTAALRDLATVGLRRVLAEPGATLAQALLDADVVDRLVLHVNPDLGPGPLRAAVTPRGRWRTERLGGAGTDVVWQQVRERDDVHDDEEG